MKTATTRLFVVSLMLIASGCDDLQKQLRPEKNECPAKLEGGLSNGSSIKWGSSEVTANIQKILVECIPRHNPATEKAAAFTQYEIAATANITYNIGEYSAPFEDSLIFEAMTSNGVVLHSSKAAFRLVRGNSTGTASAAIGPFSPEEIARVARITARWTYGQ